MNESSSCRCRSIKLAEMRLDNNNIIMLILFALAFMHLPYRGLEVLHGSVITKEHACIAII
jgi:hypothetical protein